jgi:hypothetical protein
MLDRKDMLGDSIKTNADMKTLETPKPTSSFTNGGLNFTVTSVDIFTYKPLECARRSGHSQRIQEKDGESPTVYVNVDGHFEEAQGEILKEEMCSADEGDQ